MNHFVHGRDYGFQLVGSVFACHEEPQSLRACRHCGCEYRVHIDSFAGQFVGHPALVERAMTSRQELRAATFEVFAPEFAQLSEAAREQLADAIGSALSLDAWVVLRRRDGLSVERAKAVWNLTLTALLAHELGTVKAA